MLGNKKIDEVDHFTYTGSIILGRWGMQGRSTNQNFQHKKFGKAGRLGFGLI